MDFIIGAKYEHEENKIMGTPRRQTVYFGCEDGRRMFRVEMMFIDDKWQSIEDVNNVRAAARKKRFNTIIGLSDATLKLRHNRPKLIHTIVEVIPPQHVPIMNDSAPRDSSNTQSIVAFYDAVRELVRQNKGLDELSKMLHDAIEMVR